MNDIKGKIISGVGGKYTVLSDDGQVYKKCSARGLFRLEKITPLPGDDVVLKKSGGDYSIDKIGERKNSLIRPPMANIDTLFIVCAAASPEPSYLFSDKLCAICEYNEIKPVIIITKSELAPDVAENIKKTYTSVGYDVFVTSSTENTGIDELLAYCEKTEGICVFSGESGVGKSTLLNKLFKDIDCEVGEILVPRVNVVAIPMDLPMAKIKDVFFKNGFSRLPVYTDTIDHIIGMVHEKDFLSALDKGSTTITSLIKRVAIATEHMKISTLLKTFQKSKVHMAVVVDEYGGTLGIVTLEDVLEELVGEIWDEHDEVVEYFEKLSDNTYRVDGNADLGDFFELFELDAEDDEFDSQTVGGWVTEKLGDLPKKNASFDFEHLRIIVTRCGQRRVTELKVIDTGDGNKPSEQIDEI